MSQMLYLIKTDGKEEASVRRQRLGDCFADYAGRTGMAVGREDFLSSIHKEEAGKPVTDLSGVYFNISHSRDYWCVLFSDHACGVDIQFRDERAVERIAKRFFNPFEKEWVENGGAEAFYRVWVRKESYLKFLGCGFSKGCSDCDMADEQGLLREKGGGFFQEIEGPAGYFLCVCSASREKVRVFAKEIEE